MTYSGVRLSEHARELGIKPSAGQAGLHGQQYPANRAIRVEGPFGLSGWGRLEERVVTVILNLATKAGVGMRELPYYLQPGNLGQLAIKAAMGATSYAVELLKGRATRDVSTGRLEEAVLAEAETPQQPYK